MEHIQDIMDAMQEQTVLILVEEVQPTVDGGFADGKESGQAGTSYGGGKAGGGELGKPLGGGLLVVRCATESRFWKIYFYRNLL